MTSPAFADACRGVVQMGLVLLLQTSLVLLLGLGLGWALRRYGPLAQSQIYRATLLAVGVMVAVSVTFGSASRAVWRVSLPSAPVQTRTVETQIVLPRLLDAKPPAARVSPPVSPVAVPSPAEQTPAVSPTPTAIHAAPPPSLPWQSRLYLAAALLWGMGILGRLTGLALNLWALRRLRRDSALVMSGPAFALLAALPNAQRGLTVRTSPAIRSPFLAGIRRPVIYLPASYAADFSATELQAIITHEAAHGERRDAAWMLAARLMGALLWPQPLLWLLSRRMELAAEEACDILALTQGCPPRAYANCLLSLAERLTPSRAERRLGLGVVPFRSQVGQRIQQILSGAPRPRRVSRGLRMGIACVAVIAVGMGLFVITGSRPSTPNGKTDTAEKPAPWAAPAGYLAQFTAAQRWGGDIRPVQLLPVFDKAVLYPPPLTEDDKSLIRQCKKPTVYNAHYASGGPPVHDRWILEEILARRPHFFFAEYLMGVWYKKSHDPRGTQVWIDRALQDAPAIIAGRVQFADGKPVNGYTFTPTVTLHRSANFMDNHDDYNDAQNMQYPDIVTDAQGCYYLPVFRAVYEMPGWGTSSQSQQSASAQRALQMDVMSPQTGHGGLSRFAVTGHIGVLPPMIARPYLTVGAPFYAMNQNQDHPLRVTDSTLTVTWPRSPGAANYEAHLAEVILGPHGNRSETNLDFQGNDPHFHKAVPTTELHLTLSGSTPAFYRTRLYSLVVTARDADDNQLVNSQPYYFQPLLGIAPVPLTQAGLTKILPSGFTVTSLAKTPQGGIITGTKPEASNLDSLLERNPFGWKSQASREWPLYVGGTFTGRNRFRIVYSNTGQVPKHAPIVIIPAAKPHTDLAVSVTMKGRVVYENGAHAPGVQVNAQIQDLDSLRAYKKGKNLVEEANATTGPDGSFILSGLDEAHYNVMTQEPTGKWIAAAVEGAHGKKGALVRLPDIVLTHGALISGRVVEARTNAPIEGVQIGSHGPHRPESSAMITYSRPTDRNGFYKVRVAPGKNYVYLYNPQGKIGRYQGAGTFGFHVLVKPGQNLTVPFHLKPE